MVTCSQCNWKKREEKKEVKRVSRQDSAATNKAEQVSWLFHHSAFNANWWRTARTKKADDGTGMMLRKKEGRKEGRGRQTNRQPASTASQPKTHIKYHQQNAGGTHSTYFLIHLLILNYCCLHHNPTAHPHPH